MTILLRPLVADHCLASWDGPYHRWYYGAVANILAGADPAAELKKAHEQFRPILERSEKA